MSNSVKKKTYRLKDMWVVWMEEVDSIWKDDACYKTKTLARLASNSVDNAIAITRADATEFKYGEGL